MELEGFRKIKSRKYGGTLNNIIKHFKSYNKRGVNYCDDAVFNPVTFLNYIFDFNPSKKELEVIGNECFERAWDLYYGVKNELFPGKGFHLLLEEMQQEENKPYYLLKKEHAQDYDFWIYKVRIYNFFTLSQILQADSL